MMEKIPITPPAIFTIPNNSPKPFESISNSFKAKLSFSTGFNFLNDRIIPVNSSINAGLLMCSFAFARIVKLMDSLRSLKSVRAKLIGIMIWSSFEFPSILSPSFSTIPMAVTLRPINLNCLPIGLSPPNNFSPILAPITATGLPLLDSLSVKYRPCSTATTAT